MLNITENELHCPQDLSGLKSLSKLGIARWQRTFRLVVLALFGLGIISLFLPWTQNIQASGALTTLRPEHRPQTIHATIAGRIEQWAVTEGMFVRKGDTILTLSEVKSEYFDPNLIDRTGSQVRAKEGSIEAYGGKVNALETQIEAMRRELDNKTAQIANKIEQKRLKILSDSTAVLQAQNDLTVARRQYEASQNLHQKGLTSLVSLEEKRLKSVEAETKLVKARNDLEMSRAEWQNARVEFTLTQNEFANKLAKAQSDVYSTLSDRYDAQSSVNKLMIDRENYIRRAGFYMVVAPQDGYIIKAIAPGVGEIVKEGEPVVSIQPAGYQLAVEMYVKPIDVPLLQPGSKVRFTFDGWPAFFFSGWPGLSLGTYGGRVTAIDRTISEGGKFRVLVAPAHDDAPWPEALRVGGGAKGIALLNDVPLWYELWRMLNGFPPDMYGSAKKAEQVAPTSKPKIK